MGHNMRFYIHSVTLEPGYKQVFESVFDPGLALHLKIGFYINRQTLSGGLAISEVTVGIVLSVIRIQSVQSLSHSNIFDSFRLSLNPYQFN